MSLHATWATWATCAASIARCIAATTPALADTMFSTMREAGALSESGWYRMSGADPAGTVWLTPHGGDHRYQTAPPGDIDATALPLAPPMVRGRLKAEADAFLRDARTLAGGDAIAINGGRIPIAPSGDTVNAAATVVTMLESATALFDPASIAARLRDNALRFLRDLPQHGPAALDIATATIDAQRADFSAHGPILTLAQLRAATAAPLVVTSPPPALLYKLFDPFGPRADPAQAVRLAIQDLTGAGHGPELLGFLDARLAQAEAARDRALDSRSVVTHGTALYEAAGEAWTAMQLAQTLPQTARTTAIADAARSIVLRATHALVVDSINLGSGAALLRHRTQIATDGPARADELIEQCWFYPRALRATLLAQSPTSD